MPGAGDGLDGYWALDQDALLAHLGTSPAGLSREAAERRLRDAGRSAPRRHPHLRAIANQIRSPLLLILLFAAVASAFSGDAVDAAIVVGIVVASVAISASRESRARTAIAAVQTRIRSSALVLRDGRPVSVAISEVVPGDVVRLSAGSLVPGDGRILTAEDLFVNEAVLTGESFPAAKSPAAAPADAGLRDRANAVFLGTDVRSGTATCVIVRTGADTEYGAVAERLRLRPPITDFDRGVRRFGYLLASAMLVLVLFVFLAHVLRGRPPIVSLLFSIALAVGLSPELLPAILSVNLARGARVMAQHGVVVRNLNAIENLGSMDVLCTDKTGTLTEGVIALSGAWDPGGLASTAVFDLGAINAAFETGLPSPLDDAILARGQPSLSEIRKAGELPFDFTRKRVSVIVEDGRGAHLVMKGAFAHVLQACTQVADGRPLDPAAVAALRTRHDAWAREGMRVLAVAVRDVPRKATYDREDERSLRFAGFLTFDDRPKAGAAQALADLAALGVRIKLITGDTRLVATHVAAQVGVRTERVITGADMHGLSDEALWHAAEQTDLYVEVDPNQKERIILALKKMGHVVGFLGDGVNDAPAMHAADTSLSVEHAADVAREAADFVLLERDLDVIRRGIEEGRRTFANTLKYVLTTTSANAGNMASMAAASLFLPFLPLLPGQILLNNFLSDIPAIGLAEDAIDRELVAEPGRWRIRALARFMIGFGVLSSAFDLLLFAVLLVILRATPEVFRTAWFVESLLTELAIVLVVRTRRPVLHSRPGTLLLALSAALAAIALAIPYLPYARTAGFVPLAWPVMIAAIGITGLYVATAEKTKHWFFRGLAGD